MSSAAASNKLIAPVLSSAVFLLMVALSPNHAAAQSTGSIETAQILPPGQNSCQVINLTNIDPHVYNGELESFDVTVSDNSNSYVGILAQVGNTAIPLDQITRWAGAPSGLRIHVDTPDMPVSRGAMVALTLLSSPANSPTCITVLSFEVGGSGTITSVPTHVSPSSSPSSSGTPVSNPSQSTGGAQSSPTASIGSGGANSTHTQPGLSDTGTVSTATSALAAASTAGTASPICAGSNAYRLWFILLVIYILIVAVVVFAEPWFLEDSVIGSTAAILIPLILLLAFWYFSASCRAASWIPVVACVIAIIGLFLAFREYEVPPMLPAPSEH